VRALLPLVRIDRTTVRDVLIDMPDGLLEIVKCDARGLKLSGGGNLSASMHAIHSSLSEGELDVPAAAIRLENSKARKTHFRGKSPWSVRVLGEDSAVLWVGAFRLSRLYMEESTVYDSCLESVEIRSDDLSELQDCELLGVVIPDISDDALSSLSQTNIILKGLSDGESMALAASALLQRCLPPPGPARGRIGDALSRLSKVDRKDLLLLRWVLGTTRRLWTEKIEPIPSMETMLAEALVALGGSPNPGAVPGRRRKRDPVVTSEGPELRGG